MCADWALFVFVQGFFERALWWFRLVDLQTCLVGQAKYPSTA